MSRLSCHPVPNSDFATVTCDCGSLQMTYFELQIAPRQASILGYDKCFGTRIDRGRAVLRVRGQDGNRNIQSYPDDNYVNQDNDSPGLSSSVCYKCHTIGKPEVL